MSNETAVPFVTAGPVLAAAVALPVVGAGMVALRFWARLSRPKKNGSRSEAEGLRADDWTILAALPCVTAMGILLIWGIAKKSVGYPSEPYPIPKPTLVDELLTETNPKEIVTFIVYWVVWLMMVPANGFIKMSAVLYYRRMFVVDGSTFARRPSVADLRRTLSLTNVPRSTEDVRDLWGDIRDSWIKILINGLFGICFFWTIGFFLAQIFGCGRYFWRPFGTLDDIASCHTNIRYNALMITDLITDIFVWILPFIIIWSLRMETSKKLAATAVLSLAAGSLAAAIIRLIVELDIASGGYANPVNLDLTLTLNLYYSMIETGVALIAACLPMTCGPIVRLLPRRTKKIVDKVQNTIGSPNRRRHPHDLDTLELDSMDKEAQVHMKEDELSDADSGKKTASLSSSEEHADRISTV